MITACGTIIVALGELVVRFTGAPKAGLILGGTGRAPMLTGFALVLYSRLHLVVRNRRLLNMAIILVVLVAILLDPPTIAEGVLPNDQTVGLQVIRYFEILYAVEETALASIYIYGFWSFTKGARSESRTRKTFRLLIAAEAFIVAMHIIVMTVALLGLALAKLIILHFSYALKLKVEFILLNSLVEWSKNMNTRDPPSDSVQPLSADVEKGVARPQVTQDQVSQPWRKFEQYPAAPRGANTRTAQMILNPPSCERCDPVKELAQEGGSLQIQRASCSCYDLELENKRTGDEDTL